MRLLIPPSSDSKALMRGSVETFGEKMRDNNVNTITTASISPKAIRAYIAGCQESHRNITALQTSIYLERISFLWAVDCPLPTGLFSGFFPSLPGVLHTHLSKFSPCFAGREYCTKHIRGLEHYGLLVTFQEGCDVHCRKVFSIWWRWLKSQ